MFLNLVIHEIRQNIANIRFSAGTVLCVVLTLVCVGVLSHCYTGEFDDYRACLAVQDEFAAKYAHTNRIGSSIFPQMPPAQFRPFITPLQLPQEFPGESIFNDPFTRFFPNTDLIFIVSVIMSLMAILFSYDAVSGDRERGTLQLLLSNPLSRPVLIAAKWLGGLFTLTVPFALSLLIGAIYVIMHPGIHWESGSIVTLLLLLTVSIVYISVFYLIGLLVSSRTAHSSASILVSLFIWVLFILIIPNISPYIAAQIYRVPSATKHERIRHTIASEERDELGRKFYREALLELQEKYGQPFREYQSMLNKTSDSEIRKRIAADPQLQIIHEAYTKARESAWAEANRIQSEKVEALETEYENRVHSQNRITRVITSVSPYADFLYLATDLTGTGIHAHEYFTDSIWAYYEELSPYIEKKEQEARKKDPLFDENTFIDISDRPRYTYREEPLMARLHAIRWHGVLLVVFNVLFLAGAFVSFFRYDVR